MYMTFAMHNIDPSCLPSVEHWYYTFHGPEIARRFGPWLTRCESYLPPYCPEGAMELGFFN